MARWPDGQHLDTDGQSVHTDGQHLDTDGRCFLGVILPLPVTTQQIMSVFSSQNMVEHLFVLRFPLVTTCTADISAPVTIECGVHTQ